MTAGARVAGILAWAALVVGLPGCRQPAARDADTAVAAFEGGEVTLGELERELERKAAEGERPRIRSREWRSATIEDIALREILAPRVSTDDPSLEAAAAARVESVYEAAMRERLGWSDLALSDAEVRAYYDEHVGAFTRPERLRLQHVFLRADEGAMPEDERAKVRERLESIRRQALAGADFAALAREHSDSSDGPAGGWMVLERGTPAVQVFTDVVWALATGEISPLIETPVGFHLARVAARIAAVEPPFEEVRERVRREARAARLLELEAEYLERAAPRYGVERHYERLGFPALAGDTPLFSIAGVRYTVSDMLDGLSDTYRAYFFAGYFPRIERLLEREVLRRLLVRQAIEDGVDREPQVEAGVEAALADMRSQVEFDRLLAERGATVDRAVLRRHYEKAPSRYRTPRRRSISVIRLLPQGAESLWSLLRRGEELVESLRRDGDFATAARRESGDLSAGDGGLLVDLTDDELEVRLPSRSLGHRILDELSLGEISPAFIGEVYDPEDRRMVPTGVYIVRLDEEKPSERRRFEEVEELVLADYLRRNSARLATELERELLARAGFRLIEV